MIFGTRLTVDLSQHLQFPTDRRCWQPLTLYVTADTHSGFSYAWIVTRHICFEISRRGCSYINQYWMEGSIYCTILYGRGSILLQRYKGGHCLFWDFQIPTTIESFKALPVFYYKYDMSFKGVLWAMLIEHPFRQICCICLGVLKGAPQNQSWVSRIWELIFALIAVQRIQVLNVFGFFWMNRLNFFLISCSPS